MPMCCAIRSGRRTAAVPIMEGIVHLEQRLMGHVDFCVDRRSGVGVCLSLRSYQYSKLAVNLHLRWLLIIASLSGKPDALQ